MIAVITGDIVNSRENESENWLPSLKQALKRYGNSPADWEIYRGDAFQLKTSPAKSLEACLYIKACIKAHASLDVRMAIGIGNAQNAAKKITEEQGEAFYRSGECFENLKSNKLAIETGHKEYNTQLNLLFELGALTFDRWTNTDAKTLKISLEHINATQKEIAKMLNKSSSTVSFSLQKAGYKEMSKLLNYYKAVIQKL